MDTVQKYLSLSYHSYNPVYLVGNEKKIAALPADVQAALKKAGAEMQEWSMAKGEQLDLQFQSELSRTMEVNQVDTLSFLRASIPAYKQFSAEVPQGKDLIRLLYDRTNVAATGRSWQ
jgi:TRAP-type C4-dicarboxylate transport system substrate-binding protein